MRKLPQLLWSGMGWRYTEKPHNSRIQNSVIALDAPAKCIQWNLPQNMVRTSILLCSVFPYWNSNMEHIWSLLGGIRLDYSIDPGKVLHPLAQHTLTSKEPTSQGQDMPTKWVLLVWPSYGRMASSTLRDHMMKTAKRPSDKQWSP